MEYCIIAVEDYCDTYVTKENNNPISNNRKEDDKYSENIMMAMPSLSITMRRQVHRNVSICAKTHRNGKSSSK